MAGALFFVTVLLLTNVNQQYRSGELPVTVQYTADQSSNILDVNTTLSVAVSLLGEVVAGGVTQNSVDQHGNVLDVNALAVVNITNLPFGLNNLGSNAVDLTGSSIEGDHEVVLASLIDVHDPVVVTLKPKLSATSTPFLVQVYRPVVSSRTMSLLVSVTSQSLPKIASGPATV